MKPLIAALNDPSIAMFDGKRRWHLGIIGDKRSFQAHAILEAIKLKRLESQRKYLVLWICLDPNWRAAELDKANLADRHPIRQFHDLDLETRIRAAEDLAEIANDQASEALINELRKRNLPIVAGAHRFYIKRNIRGYEPVLIDALRFYGDMNMATSFLKSRNGRLVCGSQELGEKQKPQFSILANQRGLDPMTSASFMDDR